MGKLIIVMATAFVDMMGLLVILPLLPFYAAHFGARGLVVGLLVSSVAIAQMLSALVWGRVSDRYGRRPALLAGLGLSGVGYLVFALANSLGLLFVSQLIQGTGGGTLGVIQAYVADATKPEDRARSLGWLSAATNLGVIIGPVFGSIAIAWGRAAPGLLAAALCAANLTFAWRFLAESHDRPLVRATDVQSETSRQTVLCVITQLNEPASRLIWMYAIAMGASLGMTAILSLFLAERFQVNEKTIGGVFIFIGAISVIVRAFILGWMVDRLGEARLSRLGLTLLAAGLATMALAQSYLPLVLAITLIPLGTAFTFPCVTALLSRLISRQERGLYMGVQQTLGGMALVLGPIWAGFSYDHLGRGVPFWTSSVLVLITILIGLGIGSPRQRSCDSPSAADQHPTTKYAGS